jgi:hypothetical protein
VLQAGPLGAVCVCVVCTVLCNDMLAYRRPGESGEEEKFDHIIATRAVPDFRMASHQDEAESLRLLTVEDAPPTPTTGAPPRHAAWPSSTFRSPAFKALHAVTPTLSLRNFDHLSALHRRRAQQKRRVGGQGLLPPCLWPMVRNH